SPGATVRSADAMRGFLAGATGLTPLEQVVARLARSEAPAGRWRAEELLRGFDHHTAAPKKDLVDVVFWLLGAELTLPVSLTEPADLTGLHTWKRIERTSQKVIACHALDRPHLITRQDVASLLEVLRTPIWEGNILSSLIVLFALHAQGPEHEGAVRAGLRAVLATRGPDEGVPFILDWSVGATSLAAMGLAGHPGRSPVAARLAARIAELQQPDGGWTYSPHARQTDAEDSSYCLQALYAIDPVRHAEAVARGRRYYLDLQNDDGGFPTYLRGNASEVCMTAEAAVSLAVTGAAPGAVRRAVRFIADRQRPDGTFELSWSRSHASAIFRSVRALRTARSLGLTDVEPAARRATGRAVRHLLDVQNGDGGWGHDAEAVSDEVSTAFALITLSVAGPAAPAASLTRGLGFLAARQRADGGFTCVTDEVGPRPIPYDVPHSSAGFILKGLNFVASSGRTPHFG
ncbi:prenyltransferase/squalene oxidase repeat-containing protein, partial [Actinocorallia lasiicapitis]